MTICVASARVIWLFIAGFESVGTSHLIFFQPEPLYAKPQPGVILHAQVKNLGQHSWQWECQLLNWWAMLVGEHDCSHDFPKILVMPSFYAVKFKSNLQLIFELHSIFIWSFPEPQERGFWFVLFACFYFGGRGGVGLNVFRIAPVYLFPPPPPLLTSMQL